MKKSELIRSAIATRILSLHLQAKRSHRGVTPRLRALRMSINTLSLVSHEHEQNFEMLLRIVERMADYDSTDCQYVLHEFYQEYLASF